MLREVCKGILAGLMISIGGAVYLSCQDKYIGAGLFSVALLTICYMQFSLFTGKIGFVAEDYSKKNISATALSLLGNLIGCIAFGLLMSLCFTDLVQTSSGICITKLSQPIYGTLIRAFFCGVLMYVAVWAYKFKNTVIGIFVCIPVFILSGFEHSIANMYYFSIAQSFSLNSLLYIVLCVVGNSVGGMIIPLLTKLTKEKSKNES